MSSPEAPRLASIDREIQHIFATGLDRDAFETGDGGFWQPAPLGAEAADRLADLLEKAVSAEHVSAGLAVPALLQACEAAGRALLCDSLPALLLGAWLARPEGELAGGLRPGEQRNLSVEGDALSDSASLRARDGASGWRVTGAHPALLLAGGARPVIVSARIEGGETALFSLAARAHAVRFAELDPHLPLARVELPPDGLPAAAVLAPERWRARRTPLVSSARLLVAAELCGIAEACLIRCVAYARERRQFGAPIGSFQAVSQRCADVYTAVEAARSLVHALGGTGGAVGLRDASMAKAQAGEAARCATGAAIQLMGARGVSSAAGLHWALRRQVVLDLCWGGVESCDRDVARALATEPRDARREP